MHEIFRPKQQDAHENKTTWENEEVKSRGSMLKEERIDLHTLMNHSEPGAVDAIQ